MTTRLHLAAVLCVLALALAACAGGGNGITVARVGTEQPTQPETPTEPLRPEAGSKTWTCYAVSDFRKKTPLVSLTSGALVESFAFGAVMVFGAFKPTTVSSEGFHLRWDFSDLDVVAFYEAARDGVLNKHLQYAFVLKPDGTGLYYDFSTSDDGRAKPSQIFQCLRKNSPQAAARARETIAAMRRDQAHAQETNASQSQGGITAGMREVLRRTYGERVKARVIEAWRLPMPGKTAQGIQARVLLTIDREGHVLRYELIGPSGSQAFDASLQRAVYASSPLPPLPETLSGETQKLVLLFTLPAS